MAALSAWDYAVFALMLIISSSIGLYHGYMSSKKQASTEDYLLAGRSIGWFPLFVSLVASYLSAIALLGMPSEVYTYGIQYIIVMISYPLIIAQCIFIYAPIFRRCNITSANEYLEMRFCKFIRLLGSVMFILEYVLYLSVVLYAPSLALQAVAGFPIGISLVSTCLICTVYTAIVPLFGMHLEKLVGGMKGVIWTDVFQSFIMVVSLLVVISIGSNDVGGIRNVFEIAHRGGRLNFFNFNPDPSVRHTFWTLVIGGMFSGIPVYCVSQMMVQRMLAGKSSRVVNIAFIMNIPGLMLIVGLCCMAGLVMYAVYEKCDLKESHQIKSNDQILAYFLVHKLHHLKGVPGLFMAGLFSGTLSTASSGLNSLAAVTYQDIVTLFYPNLSPKKATQISKWLAFFYGLLILGCAFLVSFVGTMVLQIAYSIHGIIGAPYMGMFAVGILFPWGNSLGVGLGCLLGFGVTLWLSVGAFIYPPDKNVLNVSIQQCSTFNTTYSNSTGIIYFPPPDHTTPLASIYGISYLWYAGIGLVVTFVFGCLFSLLFGKRGKREYNKDLLFNYAKLWLILRRRKNDYRFGDSLQLCDYPRKT